jgi:acetyl esterase/lipase
MISPEWSMKRLAIVAAAVLMHAIGLHAQPFVEPTYRTRSVKDVFFGTAKRFDGGTDSLKMNIFMPTNDNASSRPLVMWIHGGGFIQGSRADFNSLCETWAKRGYTAVTISYRLGIHGGLFDPPFAYDEAELIRACFRGIQDVRGGLRFLVKNAAAYGIDTSRIVIGGASAGSIIAMHTAFVDALDSIPRAIGKISDVTRISGTFARPDLGSVEGDLHTDVPTPGIDVVLNIFGALLNLDFLGGAPFVPMYSYHQTDDPVVACGVNRAYHGVGLISGAYPFLHGTCAIREELKRRGIPEADREMTIYQGAAHDVHDPAGVDRAAAVFASKRMTPTTSVEDDHIATSLRDGRWTLIGLDGRLAVKDADYETLRTMPDGVYSATRGDLRRMVLIHNGGVAVGR